MIHSFTDRRTSSVGRIQHQLVLTVSRERPPEDLGANSVKVALVATLIAVVLGGLAGIALARRAGVWTKPFLALVFLILVTPEIVDGIGLQIWFVNLDGIFRRGLSRCGSATRCSVGGGDPDRSGPDGRARRVAGGSGCRPGGHARTRLQARSPSHCLPGPPGRRVAGIHLQPRRRDHLPVRQRPGTTTLPVYVFSSVRQVIRPDIGAASAVMLGLTLLALGLVVAVLKRSGDSSSDIAATITGAGG